jgi:RNA polymerase sigma-70 factor (ECF subfamily)
MRPPRFPPGAAGVKLDKVRMNVPKDARPAGQAAHRSEIASVDARWQSLVEQYAGLLRTTLSRVCPRQLGLQVEDIEQEARLKLWRALRSERTTESPASYVYKTAARATIDAVRRARARREEQLGPPAESGGSYGWEVVDPQASPERQAERALVLASVRECLGRLKARRRRALALHLRGFTTEEIGRLLGWTEARARNLVYRGLKQLREALRAAGIDHAVD